MENTKYIQTNKQYKIWRYNRITGYWVLERSCTHDTMEQWYRIYSQDNPGEYYYLTSGHKPKHIPTTKEF